MEIINDVNDNIIITVKVDEEYKLPHGYEWINITTMSDQMNGNNVYLRGSRHYVPEDVPMPIPNDGFENQITRVYVNKFPEKCSVCPLTHDTDMGNLESVISCSIDEYAETRPEDCPLILEDAPCQ